VVVPAPEYVPEPLTLELDEPMPPLLDSAPPVPDPAAEGELMPLEPGALELPVPLPEVLGEADGDPLSEIPAICIAC
jgi:hypothetical protein